MLEQGQQIQEEARAAGAAERDQQRRLHWTYLIGASYAIDTVFLGLFAVAGTVTWRIPSAYALGGALACLSQYALYRSGWNLGRRDPNLTLPFVAVGAAMQLAIVAAAPQIAFPCLANLFTVFAFGMLWLRLRDSVLVWSIGVCALGAVFYVFGERFAMPVATPLERALVWGYFSAVLGRSLYLSVHAGGMRRRLEESRAKLRQLATLDELTGVFNRRSLRDHLEQERRRAERTGRPFSVALFDLDHFKAVNDAHGHAAGDRALKAFAAAVRDKMRDTDVFGRYGGEEFLMVFTDTLPFPALTAAERIRLTVTSFDWSFVAPGVRQTVSVGIAGWSAGETVEQILSHADAALYEAKRAGRNCSRLA